MTVGFVGSPVADAWNRYAANLPGGIVELYPTKRDAERRVEKCAVPLCAACAEYHERGSK